MVVNIYQKAAEKIYKKYERYLGAPNMGNQDKDCCIMTIAEIIEYELKLANRLKHGESK